MPDEATVAGEAGGQAEGQRTAGIGRSPVLRTLGAALTVGLWVADLLIGPGGVHRVLGFILMPALVQIAITDLERRRISNRVTLPAAVLALLVGLAMHPSGLGAQALGGLGAGAFLFAFALLSRGGLGMGDVKLGVMLGVFLGRYVVVALVVGLLASGVFSVGVLARRGVAAGRKTAIPLGPFLAFGGVVALLAGASLWPST